MDDNIFDKINDTALEISNRLPKGHQEGFHDFIFETIEKFYLRTTTPAELEARFGNSCNCDIKDLMSTGHNPSCRYLP